MKPVKQDKDDNCFQAALASLLELPLEAVPYYNHKVKQQTWQYNKWLFENFGLCFLNLAPNEVMKDELPFYHLAVGEAFVQPPDGSDAGHICVAKNGEIVFDPGQDNMGLKEVEQLLVLVVARPWQIINAMRFKKW